MRRLRKKRLKYGISTGVFIFGVLWLVTLLILQDNPYSQIERWRASLFLLLGMHFIEISTTNFASANGLLVGAESVFSNIPVWELRLLPIILITIGAGYTTSKISNTREFKYILENATAITLGYFPAFAIAFWISNINPELEMVVIIGLGLPAVIYIGSTVLQKLTGNLPFFGIASLGSIIILGIFVLIVGVTLISALGPAIAMMGTGIIIGSIGVYLFRLGVKNIYDIIWNHKFGIVMFMLLIIGLILAL